MRVLVHCRSFSPWRPLAFLIFLRLLQNFYVVPPTKNVSLFVFFLTRLALFLVELRRPVALLSLFLCFSLFSKFVDMTINLH